MITIIKGIRGRSNQELVEFDVEVEVDVQKLAQQLGNRALHNFSGKATLAEGAIKVSVRGKPEPVR